MQYTININQKALLEISDELDIIDATIFDFISKLMGTSYIDKKIIHGKIYYWVSYKKIIEELPMIGLKSKSAVYKRIEKLIQAGILEREPGNQESGRTYFAAGINYEACFWADTSLHKSRGGRDTDNEGGRDENIDDQITSIHQSTNDQKENTRENDNSSLKQQFEEVRQKYKEYCGTVRGFETEFKNLKKHKDWKEVIPLLLPALRYQKKVERRKKSKELFCPEWKNFKTWINQRSWEESYPEVNVSYEETNNQSNMPSQKSLN